MTETTMPTAAANDTAAPSEPVAPAVAAATLPLWTVALGWERRRGRQLIIHGEVNDRYWLMGQPVPLRELLTDVLSASCDIVGWWNPVDGLTFGLPEHEQRFLELRGRLGAGSRQSGRPGETGPPQIEPAARDSAQDPQPGPDSDRLARLRSANAAAAAVPARSASPSDLDQILDLVRRVAANPEFSSAFVFEDIDAVAPAADPASAPTYLRLRAAMRDAVVPDRPADDPPYARNAVLAVVGSLGKLPGWLYTEDPQVVALQLNRPDLPERRLWLSLLRERFLGLPPDQDLEPLVAATDGLAAWELDALAKNSYIRNVPAEKVARLLETYRFNVRVNPWARLDAKIVADSGSRLGTEVIGQERAVEIVSDALKTAFVGIDFGSSGAARPRGVFFFVGPTGTGKTQLAKSMARLLFGGEDACIRFDMSEYSQEQAAERLAGAPPGFVGYEQGGELTRRVQERPFSVLLFDEIEKANPAVLDKFLQILEDGRLTDGRGITAYFAQTMIIFTSNVGADSAAELAQDTSEGPSYAALEKHFRSAVEARFKEIGRPEIFGRLEPGIVVFDMLRTRHVAGITDRMVAQLVESAMEQRGIELVIDYPSVRAWMVERMRDPELAKYGGRQIRNELERLRTGLVRHIIERAPAPGTRLAMSIRLDGTMDIGDPAETDGVRVIDGARVIDGTASDRTVLEGTVISGGAMPDGAMSSDGMPGEASPWR